ncbi:kinesin-like protein KIF24 isoform X2 [Mastacembelus armatus]|nr:kinesin-like protein KIF24 isoform X2 [Mastacembelus armatus]
MTLCLYECLRAVGLQHHYSRLKSMGVRHVSHLTALTMEDYPILGISSMDDRTRLFHLVQMVKTDLESFIYEDDDYKGDHGYTDDSFRGYPDEDVYDDEKGENSAVVKKLNAAPSARSPCVCRQLDFSCETTDCHQRPVSHSVSTVHHNRNHGSVQGKENALPVHLQLGKSAVVCGCKGNNNHSMQSHLPDHHTRRNTKPNIRGGFFTQNCHPRLSPKCVSFQKKTKPRPATLASKRFNSKPAGHKERKGISRMEKLSTEIGSNKGCGYMAKSMPVFESKKTTGYNYGLPKSSPTALHRKKTGEQRISVCVRKRPLTHAESRRGESDVVTTPGGECLIVHESKEAVDLTQYILQHRFYFDQVFGEESSNEEVYQRTAYSLVQHMLSGGNATCFAYGQTGAGKTHTMLGSSPGRPGLYALAVRDIFAYLSNTHTHSPLVVYVSFFEIYCGQLYDLLNHRKRLFAREDGQKMVHIAGLHHVRVDSVSSLLEVISQGTEERTEGMSGVNPHSSRSHALLQIQLRGQSQEIAGRMWFVDLAGSERASDTKEPDRQSRMEGAEINQSLLALKECIRSLDQEQSHTPFRQSKLTQVLKDSFVGDSMTCMIANISPCHSATEHTLNTLRYADRVKELRGQGGLRGGRRNKALLSPKHNLFNSSSSSDSNVSTQGKSPPKKTKLERQRKSFGPATPTAKLLKEDGILCSTPKNSRWGEETNARGRKGVGLEHITPVSGWLGPGDKRVWRENVGETEGRGTENEKYERTESPSAGAGLLLGQPTNEEIKLWEVQEGVAHKGSFSFDYRDSLFSHRENENQRGIFKGLREGERWMEEQRQLESNIDQCSEVGRPRQRDLQTVDVKNKERERHLRWYHQQLQQFIPSAVSSSVRTCPSFSSSNQASLSSSVSPSSCSSLQHSSRLSVSALMYNGLEEVLDAYRAKVQDRYDDIRGQLSFPSDEICLQAEKRRPAVMEGVERRRAWLATTGAENTDRMISTMPTNVESYNCGSEERREVNREGLDASDIPADGVQSTDEEGGTDSYDLVSVHSNRLFNHPFVESPKQRAPAERPFSPACEHTNTLLGPNPTYTQVHSHQEVKAKMSVLPQDKTHADSLSCIMDPLSISLLQVDQQVATVSFLQGEHNNPSVCLLDNERGEDSQSDVQKDHLCAKREGNKVENDDEELCLPLLELPQARTHHLTTYNTMTAIDDTVRRKDMHCTTCEQGGIERKKCPVSEVVLLSLWDQENTPQPETMPSYEVLAKEEHAPPFKLSTCASIQTSVVQSMSPSVQDSVITGPCNSHNLISNSATKLSPQCTHNIQKPASPILTQQSMNTIHSNHFRGSNNSLQPNSPMDSNNQESTCHQKTGPIIHLPTLDHLDDTQWCVVQAHWEQLEVMEGLCHEEGTLLCQQPDMAFGEYINKLEKIMERKAQCVQIMRAQLQPFLKPSYPSQPIN